MNIEELGFTREELMDRAVDAIVDKMLREQVCNEYDEVDSVPNTFARALEKSIKEQIGKKVQEIAERTVLPMVGESVENTVIQKTNQWGEAKGEPFTFKEYLIDRAEHYLTEPVDLHGKTKDEQRGSSFYKSTTRVVHLIDKHLKYNIESAMKSALENANKAIVGGINTAVREQLSALSEKMKIELKVPR